MARAKGVQTIEGSLSFRSLDHEPRKPIGLANGRAVISTTAGGLGSLLRASHGELVIEEALVEAVAAALCDCVT